MLLFLVLNFSAITSNAQSLINKKTFVFDSVKIMVGDDITIGKPSTYDFVNITKMKRLRKIGKIANVVGDVGFAAGMIGATSGDVDAAMTGVKVMQGASTAASIGWTAAEINQMNVSNRAKQIIGKKFRVLKFKKKGNKRRGEHLYGIVAGEGHTNYKIELAPAIKSKEVIAINDRLLNVGVEDERIADE